MYTNTCFTFDTLVTILRYSIEAQFTYFRTAKAKGFETGFDDRGRADPKAFFWSSTNVIFFFDLQIDCEPIGEIDPVASGAICTPATDCCSFTRLPAKHDRRGEFPTLVTTGQSIVVEVAGGFLNGVCGF